MIASDTGRPVSLRDRLSLLMHLAMCRYCRAYARGLRLLGDMARHLMRAPPAETERTRATLEAVRQAARSPAED